MKIKEMISLLGEMDQDADLLIQNAEYCTEPTEPSDLPGAHAPRLCENGDMPDSCVMIAGQGMPFRLPVWGPGGKVLIRKGSTKRR